MTTDDHDHPSTETRLRDALAERAATIEPSPGGLDRIEEELMSEPTANDTRNRWIIGALSAAAAVVLVLVAVTVFSDDDDDGDTDVAAETTTSTSADSTTTSTTPATTTSSTTTTFAPVVDRYQVAFPSPDIARRFDAPEPAAQAYGSEVLGFTDLVVGEFRPGDSRSGEVPISDREGGRETTLLLRQMDDDSWFVLGSTTENITVDQPVASDPVDAPFVTSGSALAFEGNVVVQVLTQDDLELLGEGFVTGSGVPPAGPFEGEIDFQSPREERPGIVVYLVRSPEDGRVTEAVSFPVRLLAG